MSNRARHYYNTKGVQAIRTAPFTIDEKKYKFLRFLAKENKISISKELNNAIKKYKDEI